MIDGVPLRSKVIILCATFTVLTSFILYALEIDTFANSICNDKKNYVSAFIYINLLILIPFMALTLSLFNMELIDKTPYTFKITFLKPWLLWGICPIFELPLMVYDHLQCQMQSPFYTYSASYDIGKAVGIFFLIVFGCFIGFLTCIMNGINCGGLLKCSQNLFEKYLFPLFVVALNVMSFILTFTQFKLFLPVLYFHNYAYYLMFLMMGTFYVLLNACKMKEKFHLNEKIMEFSKINN